jgi:hypothetical protein
VDRIWSGLPWTALELGAKVSILTFAAAGPVALDPVGGVVRARRSVRHRTARAIGSNRAWPVPSRRGVGTGLSQGSNGVTLDTGDLPDDAADPPAPGITA